MALFVDVLDIELQVLAWGLLAVAAWVFLRFALRRQDAALDRGFGFAFTALGVYALVMGVWASAVWPLPSSYNIVLADPYALYGVAMLMLGLALAYGAGLEGPIYTIALLSLSVFIYGADILSYGLTKEPAAASIMYFLIGLSGLLGPLLLYRRTSRWGAYLVIALLVLAALLAAYTGASATFEHTAGWTKWVPFYG